MEITQSNICAKQKKSTDMNTALLTALKGYNLICHCLRHDIMQNKLRCGKNILDELAWQIYFGEYVIAS